MCAIRITISSIGDDAVSGGSLETVTNGSVDLTPILIVLGHSYCWLSLHRIPVISEM